MIKQNHCTFFRIVTIALHVIILFSFCSCTDTIKVREDAISEYMNRTVSDFPLYECVETHHMDSIQDQPYDYECLTVSLQTWESFMDIAPSWVKFLKEYGNYYKFRQGKIQFKSDTFPVHLKLLYDTVAIKVRDFAVLKGKLTRIVGDFQPHSYIRTYKKYRYKDEGKYAFKHCRFYFDDDLNLKNQLVLSEFDNNKALALLLWTQEKDFTPLYKLMQEGIGFDLNEEFIQAFIPTQNLVNNYSFPRESQSNSNVNVNERENVVARESRVEYSHGSDRKIGSNRYYVIMSDCAGAISKEANKRYLRYSVNDNTPAIREMLLMGELVMLKRGEKVEVLDLGMLTSKIRTSRGDVLYVDTENIEKL